MSELTPKTDVEYRQDTEGTPCSNCTNYITPGKCALVEGKIAANGTCDLYLDKTADSNAVANMLFGGQGAGLNE